MHGLYNRVLGGLDDEQINRVPDGGKQNIAFSLWHYVRTEDNVIQFVMQRKPTVWMEGGWDAKFGLLKSNPIADWSSKQVWQYIRQHDVPYNALHESNYPSIGCTHCTRAVRPGEDPRAGRWSGSLKTECGLHA